MIQDPLFSIIVPACEVEEFLSETIASVRVQSADFECLVVVEESRDGTERVARETTAGDARFRVMTEPRSGSPATPRNTALDAARGTYVVFLDGDDTLTPTALADLTGWIFRYPDADLFPCAIREGARSHDNYPCDLGHLPLSGPEATVIAAAHGVSPLAMAQMTVCRRSFLQEAKLRFVPGLIHEDAEFTPRALYLAKSVVPTHLPFYLYRRRAGSITDERAPIQKQNKRLFAYATVYRNLFHFHAKTSPSRDVSKGWARNWLNMFNFRFFYTVHPADCVLMSLRQCLDDDGRDFLSLARHAHPVKRVGAYLTVLAAKTGWLWPVRAYFKAYYRCLGYHRPKSGKFGKTVPES